MRGLVPQGDVVRVPANGFEFRARVAGLDNTGPGVVLLHGFPETSAMWQPLIELLASQGYRVVAFDQRGYSPGARPDDVASYAIEQVGTMEHSYTVADFSERFKQAFGAPVPSKFRPAKET